MDEGVQFPGSGVIEWVTPGWVLAVNGVEQELPATIGSDDELELRWVEEPVEVVVQPSVRFRDA